MTTLIAGATGFLGSHIVKKLVKRGEKVKVLLRKTSNTSNIENIDFERVYGDILDGNSIKDALEGCDTLYHTAGLTSSKKADYKKMEDINIKGTINVLSAALESGIKKAVYTSSVAAIGADSAGGVINENTTFMLENEGIQYVNTKYHAEKEALKIYEKGLPLVIVNPSVVLGPGDIYLSTTGLIIRYCKKRIPGYLDSGFNVVDVEDVAEGHILAAEKGRTGERYILGNKNITILELFKLMEEITGIPSPKMKFPYFFALTMGFIVERILGISLPNFSAMDIDTVKLSKFNWYCDSTKAIRELGFPQTPIEETLEKTVKWFKDNGYL